MTKNALIVFSVLAGIAAGYVFTGSAQTAPAFTLCYGATLWAASGKEVNNGEKPRDYLRVPKGWTVVGGAQHGGEAAVVLCK